MPFTRIILASSSKSRQLLLQRLRIPFTQHSPSVDESPLANESAEALTLRLAKLKVDAVVAQTEPEPAIVIGSDQVAGFQGRIIGKPAGEEQATKELLAMSGQSVSFFTGLCVRHMGDDRVLSAVERTDVMFRNLKEAEIRSYVQIEQPFDAAGGFHSEGLGIALFQGIKSNDPTSLIGLPLIRLTEFLQQFGVTLLTVQDYHQPQHYHP